MNKLLVIVFLAAFSLVAADKYQYAEIEVSSIDDIKFLQKNKIDIDRTSFGPGGKTTEGNITVYVDEKEFGLITDIGYEIEWAPQLKPKYDANYRFNEDIEDSMDVWVIRYPDICRKEIIGYSVENRPLLVLKISDNVDTEEAEPEVKFIATMHGDEPVGTEMELEMIEDILYGYQANNDTMRFIVNNTELYVFPLMNPDGMANDSRYNSNGVDLNRNFPEGTNYDPDIIDSYDPYSGSETEVENEAVMTWTQNHNFVLSTNYHTGAEVANYPYDKDFGIADGDYAACPDDNHVSWLAYGYASRNSRLFSSSSFTNGVTNGCDWYSIDNGMQDWNYRYHNDIDMTLELSNTKWPSFTEISTFWQDNRDAMFWYLSAAHKGIYGIVTDSSTGLPLDATIEIAGIDKEYYTDPDCGDYYRILKPGTYTMTVSAPGYYSQTINNIVVNDDTGKFREATEVNVALQKAPRPDITLSQTDTLRISAAPSSTGQAQFNIGNIDSEDLNYSLGINYKQGSKAGGGPDSFGYTWKDSDDPDGSVYNWIDIRSSGTVISLADDGISDAVNIGFPFNFYGTEYTTLGVGDNGAITFTGTNVPSSHSSIPSASSPNALIAPFWNDLNSGSNQSGDVYHYYDSVNSRFIVEYYNIVTYGTSDRNTFEIILNADGTIIFQYDSMNGALTSCTVGIENETGNVGTQITYNSSYIKNDLALEFNPNFLPEWLSVNPVSGTVSQSGSDNITATGNAADLSYGNYFADIIILSNDPDESELILPVKLTVTDALSAPSNLIVVNATSSQVDLEWDAVSGATLYHIYRSSDPYSGFAEAGISGTNNYQDTGVTAGNKYFYYVTADSAK